jgi:hypothetical protein
MKNKAAGFSLFYVERTPLLIAMFLGRFIGFNAISIDR